MKSNNLFRLLPLFLTCIILLLTGCSKKDEPGTIPDVTTKAVSNITGTSADSGGEITSDGGADIIARGVCWNTNADPTVANSKTSDGSGQGTFTSQLTGLSQNTTYHIRAYATNSKGTAYGADVIFTTTIATVTIGSQVWMAKNLDVTNYRNGDPIPNVTDGILWISLTAGAYTSFNNLNSNSSSLGHLYNWFAVNDPRNICPAGWHIPSQAEWVTLFTSLGGEAIAGGKMKATGVTNWETPNAGATNVSGFSALGAGHRHDTDGGSFGHLNMEADFWTSEEMDLENAYYINLYYNLENAYLGSWGKEAGYSVRCIKD
jgi:uncharacterized protein (TIGR02145 family)